MINLIRSDVYWLRKSKFMWGILFTLLLSAVVVTACAGFYGDKEVGGQMRGVLSGVADPMMISFTGSLAASYFIQTCLENKNVHRAVTCGLGRGRITVSKGLVYFMMILLMNLPYIAVTMLALCTGRPFSGAYSPSIYLGLLQEASGMELTGPLFGKALAVMLTMAVVYGGRMSICVFTTFAIKKGTSVVINVFATMILPIGALAVKERAGIFKSFLEFTPYGVDYTSLNLHADIWGLARTAAGSLIFLLLMLAASCCVFRKAEVR